MMAHWIEILQVSLLGGVLTLDRAAAFQLMLSRPLVAASAIGLLLGEGPRPG